MVMNHIESTLHCAFPMVKLLNGHQEEGEEEYKTRMNAHYQQQQQQQQQQQEEDKQEHEMRMISHHSQEETEAEEENKLSMNGGGEGEHRSKLNGRMMVSLVQLPMESIVHCLSFLHSKEIFRNVIPVCKLFQSLTYTRQLWDSLYFCTPKITDVNVAVLDKFPIRHTLINSKQFSLQNLLRIQAGLQTLKSVVLSSISVDYRNFILLLNGITCVEKLVIDRCKIINYFELPVDETNISNEFEHLRSLELRGLQGDYETKLKILQLVVARAKHITNLTMTKNNPLLLPELIYQQFHPQMKLESLSLEEEHLFHQNQETHILDNFFQQHCSSNLKKLTLVNCRYRFDTMLSHCRDTLEQLLVVSGFWHPPLNEIPYPRLSRLARLTMISCHIHVVERILSDCVSESILQIKLAGPSRNYQSGTFFKSPKLKSFKSHYILPFSSLSSIILTCERSLECLEFAFAKRTLLPSIEWQPVVNSLSHSLMHLSIDNVKFDDQWWLLKLLRDLQHLETLRIDTASGELQTKEDTCLSISHACHLRVLILDDCDITADCFDRVLQYCGAYLEQLSCDFSYDKKNVISEKMQSIALQCKKAVLTIDCMDHVPTKLDMFLHELPLITFNVRDLSLEDMILLSVICDRAKAVEFNKDQGAINFGLVETNNDQSLVDSQTLEDTLQHVIKYRVANLNIEQRNSLCLRYYKALVNSSQHNGDVLNGSVRGLLKALNIHRQETE